MATQDTTTPVEPIRLTNSHGITILAAFDPNPRFTGPDHGWLHISVEGIDSVIPADESPYQLLYARIGDGTISLREWPETAWLHRPEQRAATLELALAAYAEFITPGIVRAMYGPEPAPRCYSCGRGEVHGDRLIDDMFGMIHRGCAR